MVEDSVFDKKSLIISGGRDGDVAEGQFTEEFFPASGMPDAYVPRFSIVHSLDPHISPCLHKGIINAGVNQRLHGLIHGVTLCNGAKSDGHLRPPEEDWL